MWLVLNFVVLCFFFFAKVVLSLVTPLKYLILREDVCLFSWPSVFRAFTAMTTTRVFLYRLNLVLQLNCEPRESGKDGAFLLRIPKTNRLQKGLE